MTATQEQTYQALRSAMLRAQEAGVRIVCEAFAVLRDDGSLAGCCAIGALTRFGDDRLGLGKKRQIIRAFDGLPFDLQNVDERREFYDVGLRLRDEFQPITATALERELEGA